MAFSLASATTLLQSIAWGNTAVSPSVGVRTIVFNATDDEDAESADSTLTLDIYNNAPVIDLNGASGGINASGTFTEGDAYTSYLTSATLTDADSDPLVSLVMTAGGQFGDDGPDELIKFDTWVTDSDTDLTDTLVVGSTTFSLAFVALTGVLTVTKSGGGTFPAADGQALQRLFQYANSAEPPTTGARTFSWVASDGTDNSTAAVLTVTVAVASGNEPAITTNTGLTIEQGEAPTTITTAMLETTDADTAASSLTYTLTTAPAYGTLALDGVAMAETDTFTQQDIDDNLVTYEHDDEFNVATSDSFAVSVSDGTDTDTATFTITIDARPLPWQPLLSADLTYDTDWNRAADIDVDTDHSGDLQAAIEAAVAQATSTGLDIIVELTAGSSYSRSTADFKTYRLPTRPSGETNWIVLRSSNFGATPAVATTARVIPSDASDMAKLPMGTADGLPTLATDGPAHHYWLIGLDFEVGSRSQAYGPIQIGQGYPVSHVTDEDWKIAVANVADIDDLPSYICVDRCLIHSTDDTLSTGKLRQGIRAEGRYICIRNCDISNVKDTQDAQAIWACYGTGPYHIENNFLEATGENIMFGGDTTPWEGTRPSDITVVGNHLQKNIDWKAPNLWGVKNLFELKNAKRVLFEGNILDTCWADGQNGDAFVLTARNQTYERSAATSGENPWAEVSDITIRKNLIHDVGLGLNSHVGDNLNPSRTSKRWNIYGNVFYNVRSDYYSAARLFRVTTFGVAHARTGDYVRVEHNTALFKDDLECNSAINRENESGPDVADNVAIKNNILGAGQYWLSGPGVLNGIGADPPLYSNVRMVRPEETNYATWVSAGDQATFYNADDAAGVDFEDYAGGDFLAGDWTLAATSRFKASGSADADDGEDMGADIAALNTAIAGVLVSRVGNSAPVVLLDGATANESGTFTEGDAATAFIASATVTDADSDPLASATMVCAGGWGDDTTNEAVAFGAFSAVPGSNTSATVVTAGSTDFSLTYTDSSGTIAFAKDGGGTMPLADFQTLLRTFTYDNNATPPTETARTFTVVGNDGTDNSSAAVLTVSVAATPTAPEPVAHWTLDDNAATTVVVDETAGLNLALVGGDNTADKQTTGQIAGAFLFNGTDDYLYASSHRGYDSGGYTIAFWVKRSAAAGLVWYCSSNTAIYNGYMTIQSGDSQSNRAKVVINNTAGTTLLSQESTSVVLDGTWHHVAFVDDGAGNATLYVDGVEDASDFSYTPSGTISYNQLTIGALRRNADMGQFWSGSLDDIRVYDQALAEAEVGDLIA